MKKIISLVGARPQIIKEAVLYRKLRKQGIVEVLVHSGQHYDYNMSNVFFKVLNIREPDYNLGVGSNSHAVMTAKIMIEFEKVVLKEKPDLIIVYGDTNTTIAGALVGAKLKIPVAHVEAGIRQNPKDMPEEINRVVTDHVSKLLFAPSRLAVENLRREGITDGVYFTGDIMYDLFLMMKKMFDYSILEKLSLKPNEYIVVTIHRDFNTDDPERLKAILKELERIANDIRVIFPIHPRTRKAIERNEFENLVNKVELIDPVDYLSMMGLVCNSRAVITDSGGLQKEAYYCRKQAIVVMPDTGWKELVEVGWNVLSDPEKIRDSLIKINDNENREYPEGIYGDGNAGERIVDVLLSF